MSVTDSNGNGISRERLINIGEKLREANLCKKELNFKLLVIGDYGVGKTSIIKKYTKEGIWPSNKVTIGADFALKTLEWDEETRINIRLWDTVGQDRSGFLTGIFCRHAVGAVLVFDLTRPETFNSVKRWLDNLRNKISLPGGRPIPTILLANKCDITTQTLPKEINDFCLDNGIMGWFITSAKTNTQIDEAMLRLTNAVLINHHSLQFPLITDDVIKFPSGNGVGPPNDSNKKKYCSVG